MHSFQDLQKTSEERLTQVYLIKMSEYGQRIKFLHYLTVSKGQRWSEMISFSYLVSS